MTSDPAISGRAGRRPEGLATLSLPDGPVLAVVDEGPRDAPVTVVLVHGWTQDHTSWEDVTDRLRTDHPGLRVVVPDFRGHGWSDAGPRGTGTIEQFGDDLAAVLDGLVPHGPVVLAGHSMGGPVIMAFAERHPTVLRERVRGVALVATSAAGLGRDVFGLPGALTAPAMLAAPVVTRVRSWSRARVNLRHPAPIAAVIRTGFYGPGQGTVRNRRRTAAQVGRSHPATTAQLLEELLHHDRIGTLSGFAAVPTLVLAGTRDGLCPMAHSRAMAQAVPGAELVVYPGAGHMLPYERADEVSDQLARLAHREGSRSGRSA